MGHEGLRGVGKGEVGAEVEGDGEGGRGVDFGQTIHHILVLAFNIWIAYSTCKNGPDV